MQRLHLTLLDTEALKPADLDLSLFEKFGSVQIYDRTEPDQIVARCKTSDVVIVNKIRLTPRELDALPKLRLICLFATGYDNVDVAYCKEKGISVFNVQGYGTESVAQHVFSFMLHHTNQIALHDNSVHQGEWSRRGTFCYSLITVRELAGKNIGIVGYGQIGQRIGELARAFGMKVLIVDRGKASKYGEEPLPLKELLRRADYVTLHTPLTEDTQELLDSIHLSLMKKTAVLINTGRGALVNEVDLAKALNNNNLAAAYLDVLCNEPPDRASSTPIFSASNCYITPHMAWHSLEARQRLLSATLDNIEHFINGCSNKNRLA